MLEFVEFLLNSRTNIIDQLILLKKFKKNKEVKKYIKTLERLNISPFERSLINKFYHDLDIKTEEIPKNYYPKLPSFGESQLIKKLIDTTDDMKKQILNLKKHNKEKAVIEYTESTFPRFIDNNPYARYLILHYYYDIPYPEVYPTPESLRITLCNISFSDIVKKQAKREDKIIKKNKKRLKVGNKVILCSGPFKGIEGVVTSHNEKTINVELMLFGQKVPCEIDKETKYKKVRFK